MEELFQIFTNVGDASFAVDSQQRILFWNAAAENLVGLSAEAAIGQPCWQVLQGKTVGGRPFCRPDCPVLHARQANQPLRAFDLLVSTPAQETLLTNMSTIFVPSELRWPAALIHLQRCPETPFHWPDPA